MIGFVVIGIMLLCGCSLKSIGVFCIAYGIVGGFVKLIVELLKNR